MPDKTSSSWDNWKSEETAAHLHALGALSSGYNSLEGVLLDAIKGYCDMPSAVANFVFEKLQTNTRIQLLQKAMSLKVIDAEVRDAIDWFVRGYGVCTDNRNLIVHSSVYAFDSNTDSLITSKRSRKDGDEHKRDFSLDVIRRVSDEISEFSRYGGLIFWHLRRVEIEKKPLPEGWQPLGPNTLPKKPALPNDLAHMLRKS